MMDNVSLTNRFAMRGDLCLVVKDAVTGEVKRRVEIRNKITFLAADVLVELLAQRVGDPAADHNQMWSMRVGSSNTPASRSDSNIGTFVFGMQLFDVNKVTGAPGELEFTATLGAGDGNGSSLQEAGLFTKGSAGGSTFDTPGVGAGATRLFARQIFPAVDKTVAITIDLSWRIAFTA